MFIKLHVFEQGTFQWEISSENNIYIVFTQLRMCCHLRLSFEMLTNTLNWHYVFRCIGSNSDLMLVVCPLTSFLRVPWEQFNPKRTVHTWHTAAATKTAKEYRLNFIHRSKRRNDDSQSISDRWQTASRILERRHMECRKMQIVCLLQ